MANLHLVTEDLPRLPRVPFYILWTDTNGWSPVLEEKFRKAGATVVRSESTKESMAWLEAHPDLKNTDALCVVTNQTRPELLKAGTDLIEQMRKLGWGATPALIFCGVSNWRLSRATRPDLMCAVADDHLRDFVLLGRPGVQPFDGSVALGGVVPVSRLILPLDDASLGLRRLRFVIVSDTQAHHPPRIPYCDYVIHAGNFTSANPDRDVPGFSDWVRTMQMRCRYGVLVVAGKSEQNYSKDLLAKHVGEHCRFMQDEFVNLGGNMIMYGAGWHGGDALGGSSSSGGGAATAAGSAGSAAAVDGASDEAVYQKMTRADISPSPYLVVSNQPPSDYLDVEFSGDSVGSVVLRDAVVKTKPLIHICGNNPQGYGAIRNQWTVFIGATLCKASEMDKPSNERSLPIVVDIPVCSDQPSVPRPALAPLSAGTEEELIFETTSMW